MSSAASAAACAVPLAAVPGVPAPPVLRIDGLEVHYPTHAGQWVHALDGVSLDIAKGEFIALLGPSGCGKTTLLKTLAGLMEGSHQGRVTLEGQPITGPSLNVGVVFQEPTLLPWRTVLDNVLLPVELVHLDPLVYRPRALELMHKVGLAGFEHKYPKELSGGMRQRAGICRALVRDPELLLMDEPFGALDALTREFLNVELQRLWLDSGKTVVFVTHSIPEAVFLADRVVVMSPRPGRIAEVIDITTPRPRRLDDMSRPEVGEVLGHIRQHFSPTGALD